MTRQYIKKDTKKEKVPIEKPIKPFKYNIKYINNDEEILFENNYHFIKDSLEDLKKVCPTLSLRRLRLINEKEANDSLKKYIIMTRLDILV
jgi:hypothetical protein